LGLRWVLYNATLARGLLRIDHDPGGRRGSKVATMCVIFPPCSAASFKACLPLWFMQQYEKWGQFCVSGVAELDELSANLNTGEIEGR
jgi:hypothetical protein